MSETIKQYLRSWGLLRERMLTEEVEGWRYHSLEALVLDLGKPYTRVPKPKGSGVRMGRMKHCFTNASRAVWQNSNKLTYVEGYACGGFPCMHAWVTPNGTDAWDLTWPYDERHAQAEYLGIAWSMDFLTDVALETGFYGVLGSGDDRFIARLLKDGPPHGAVQEQRA